MPKSRWSLSCLQRAKAPHCLAHPFLTCPPTPSPLARLPPAVLQVPTGAGGRGLRHPAQSWGDWQAAAGHGAPHRTGAAWPPVALPPPVRKEPKAFGGAPQDERPTLLNHSTCLFGDVLPFRAALHCTYTQVACDAFFLLRNVSEWRIWPCRTWRAAREGKTACTAAGEQQRAPGLARAPGQACRAARQPATCSPSRRARPRASTLARTWNR